MHVFERKLINSIRKNARNIKPYIYENPEKSIYCDPKDPYSLHYGPITSQDAKMEVFDVLWSESERAKDVADDELTSLSIYDNSAALAKKKIRVFDNDEATRIFHMGPAETSNPPYADMY